ncbi:asparaginase [Georgenia thermotolerans]|uniref:Asparaginase n=1 Tax=Georgenia thermotolerans TaxID=527326 RepID=A0A7J5USP7_9MICO|nr:asparaginase [Georgenia thermotolerans]KAE8765426.1 asparaginase [Georgenia thermotolerans]
MTLPTVAVGALGGTIAMTPAHPGEPVAPELSAAQLVRAVRGLDAVAHVTATSLRNLPSPALTTADVLDALAWARAQVDSGAAGVVLTHGTDTLEESAFLLDLLWDRPAPLVLTGAMRPPRSPGPDGPANLYAAVVVAAAPAARDLGAVVVLDDEVHLARWATKTRTAGVGAFASPGAGPVGRVVEGRLVLILRPARRDAPLPDPAGAAQVALLEFALGDDGGLLRLVAGGGFDGVVVAGAGAGHVSPAAAEAVSCAVERMPVLVASRTGSGPTATRTYGYLGSETDLARRGAQLAGSLTARKARLLLWALLAGGADAATVRREVARRAGLPGD